MKKLFFREHKYVQYVLSRAAVLFSQANFIDKKALDKIEDELNNVKALLAGHAKHEDSEIFPLLKTINEKLYHELISEHSHHAALFAEMELILTQIKTTTIPAEKIKLGEMFYLKFQSLQVADMQHRLKEEMQALPALQDNYSDEELRSIEAKVYNQMTIEQTSVMLITLFPHFNANDRLFFFTEISKTITRAKFVAIFVNTSNTNRYRYTKAYHSNRRRSQATDTNI